MKYILPTVVLLIRLTHLNAQDQWEIVNEGFYFYFESVDFINKDTGWHAREEGMFKTEDGAENWSLVYDDTKLQEVDFYNDSIGWAIGEWGEIENILKTIDGGQTWFPQRKVEISDLEILINNLVVISENIVYAIGDSILKTVDGGLNWENISPSDTWHWNSAWFFNNDTGIVIGSDGGGDDFFLRTFDGGNTWDLKSTGLFHIMGLQIIDGSTGYFCNQHHGVVNIFSTNDFFESWTKISALDSDIRSFHCFGKDTMIVLANTDEVGANSHILKSVDGGFTWTNTDHMPLFYIPLFSQSQFLVFDNAAYLIVSNHKNLENANFILKSTDQGNQWECLNSAFPLRDIHFVNQDKGFIVGGFDAFHIALGIIQMTQDGGNTWDPILYPDLPTKIHFSNDSLGFISNFWGESVYTTADGGENWVIDNNMNILAIYHRNDSVSILMGSDNISDKIQIQKTTNGGRSWSTIVKFGTSSYPYYYSICLIDENTGYVVGDGGQIIRFSDNGKWESIGSGTTLPLRRIEFVNNTTGWISGGYSSPSNEGHHPIFLRTHDGGGTWNKVPDLNYLVNDFFFLDSFHGWAVGKDSIGKGVILESFDGGLTWELVMDSLSGGLTAIDFKDGVVCAVGDNSLIIRMEGISVPLSGNRFMVVGDAHHYSPSPDFSQSMLYELSLAAIEEEVDFVFFTGDIGMRPFTSPEEEAAVLKDWRFVLDTLYHHNIRVFACRGNVDTGSREAWDSLFSGIYAFPQNGPEMEKNLSYAIDYDNILFLALDQYTDAHKINQGWLDSILSTNTKEHIFAAGHEPAFKLRNSNCMGAFPEERNLFWESLTNAGALAYFSGHDHFYDHALIDDGDDNPDNDIHQVITGTGGGSIFSDSEYNGDNGRWTPERLFHEEEHGYVLVELNGDEVELTWKHRIDQNIFEDGGDSYIFTKGTSGLQETNLGNDVLINYPNPFQSRTVISYQLPSAAEVELNIYDLTGRKITTLLKEQQQAGRHEIEWNAKEFKPGIYFCEFKTGNHRQVIKMILIQ